MIRVRNVVATVYETATPDSIPLAFAAVIGLVIFLTLFAVSALGVLAGASAALDGEPIDVEEVSSIESTIWVDMTEGNAISRSIYGLFHWVVALATWLAILSMEAGYSTPAIGHVVAWVARPMPYIIIGLIAIQLVRVVELFSDKDISAHLRGDVGDKA